MILVCIQEDNRHSTKVVVGERYEGRVNDTLHDDHNYWVVERTRDGRIENWGYHRGTFIPLDEYRDILIESIIS